MSERTGLGALEVAALRATDALSGPTRESVQSAQVLRALEDEGYNQAYLYPVLQDLAVPWKRHLLLLEGEGNFGSPGNDPAADAVYTEVRLSALGRLALRSEDGDAGPVPLGLIDGTVYCGGRVPPFRPRSIVDALAARLTQGDDGSAPGGAGAFVEGPTVPTGAVIDGDVAGLLRGESAALSMSCAMSASTQGDRNCVVITGFPLGENVDQIVDSVVSRVRWPDQRRGGGEAIVADVQDHTSGRLGVRIVVILHDGVDPSTAERWLRTVWPVSVDVDWRLPAPMDALLRTAATTIRAEPSGFDELRSLLVIE